MNDEITGKKIDSICFVTPEYPVEGDMTNTFVDALICEIARQGIKCTVIAPFDVFRYLRHQGKKRPRHWTRVVNDKVSFEVFAPPFYGFTGHRGIADLSQSIYNKTVLNEYKRVSKTESFDAVYGHFFGSGGVPAELIERQYGIPSFVACGESSLSKLYRYEDQKKFIECLTGLTGIICVSTKNQEEIINTWGKELGKTDALLKKTRIFPNAYSKDSFFKMNKNEIRDEFAIGRDEFVVSFLGRFQEHKGLAVLNQALAKLEGTAAIFIGSGEIEPKCEKILFAGKVNHDDVAKYLNASDVFVLPTRAEGCSNAIVEALACGLPIVSSDLPFNYDILNTKNSILVDPLNVDEVALAIDLLRKNQKIRMSLSEGALNTAKTLTINARARNIVEFMNSCIEVKYR